MPRGDPRGAGPGRRGRAGAVRGAEAAQPPPAGTPRSAGRGGGTRPGRHPQAEPGLGGSRSDPGPRLLPETAGPPRCGRTRPGAPGPTGGRGTQQPRASGSESAVAGAVPCGGGLQLCYRQRNLGLREPRAGAARAELEDNKCTGPPSRPGPGRAYRRRAAKGRQGPGGTRRLGPLPRAPLPSSSPGLPIPAAAPGTGFAPGRVPERTPPRSRPVPSSRPRGRHQLSSRRGAAGRPGASTSTATSPATPGERRSPVPVTHPRPPSYLLPPFHRDPGPRPRTVTSIHGSSESTGRGAPLPCRSPGSARPGPGPRAARGAALPGAPVSPCAAVAVAEAPPSRSSPRPARRRRQRSARRSRRPMLRSRPHHGAPAGRAPAAAANPRPAAPRAPPTAASPPMARGPLLPRHAPLMDSQSETRTSFPPSTRTSGSRPPVIERGQLRRSPGEGVGSRPSTAPIAASLEASHAPRGCATAPAAPPPITGCPFPALRPHRLPRGPRPREEPNEPRAPGHTLTPPPSGPTPGRAGREPAAPEPPAGASREHPHPRQGTGSSWGAGRGLAAPGRTQQHTPAHSRVGSVVCPHPPPPRDRGSPGAAGGRGHPLPSSAGGDRGNDLPVSWDMALRDPLLGGGEHLPLLASGESTSGSHRSPQGHPDPSPPPPAMLTDHSLVRQRRFNGPRAEPTAAPSPPCSVDHQAAADRWQELEEALEGDRPSGWGDRQRLPVGLQAAS